LFLLIVKKSGAETSKVKVMQIRHTYLGTKKKKKKRYCNKTG